MTVSLYSRINRIAGRCLEIHQSRSFRQRMRSYAAMGLVAAMSLSGCTFQRAYISYPEVTTDLPLRATPFEGEPMGVIRASEGGAVWKDCTSVAEASIWMLIQQTRALGGNAIGDIRWFPAEPKISRQAPVCKQKWGWILLWPMLLTPAFQRSRVEAVAYRVDEAQLAEHVFLIPDDVSDHAELVDRIVLQTLP